MAGERNEPSRRTREGSSLPQRDGVLVGNTFRVLPSCVQSRPFTRTTISNAWSHRTWFSFNTTSPRTAGSRTTVAPPQVDPLSREAPRRRQVLRLRDPEDVVFPLVRETVGGEDAVEATVPCLV